MEKPHELHGLNFSRSLVVGAIEQLNAAAVQLC